MERKQSIMLLAILLSAAIGLSGCGAHANPAANAVSTKSAAHLIQTQSSPVPHIAETVASSPTKVASTPSSPAVSNPNPLPEWEKPTGGAYPVLTKGESLWIHVSVSKQRVYIMHNNQVLYTMIASTGLDTNPNNSTPEGTFHIQKERGTSFYYPPEKEGARYWVSWKNHGEFLFHSVPIDKKGNIIVSEAKKLGHKASYGCIRLSVPDAKWFYENIPLDTKVVIGK